jgi:lysophospholipase L1-like esterase
MKKILIYGDSNVWGDNFLTGIRIPDDKQWVNILQKKLGSEYQLLQEGLPGRLAGSNEKEKVYKNGKDTFISTFRTNAPVDMLIIALGTNDLQFKYNKTGEDVINDLIWYKNILEEMIKDEDDKKKYFVNGKMPEMLYILPINFDYKVNASVIFDEQKEIERQKIISYFNNKKIKNIIFNDIDLFDDGIHLNYDGHKKMADRVFGEIKYE